MEAEVGRKGRSGRREGRGECGRRRGEACGSWPGGEMRRSGRGTRRRTEEAAASRNQSRVRDRRGELATRRRSLRGRPRRAWRWG